MNEKVILAAVLLCATPVLAKGRKPAQDQDYPDYNRLELHPKVPTPLPPSAGGTDMPPAPVPLPPTPKAVPAVTTVDDTTPLPPPKAIPVPNEASEPPMPDDMIKTLDGSAPTQSSTTAK